jgi:uncharacterized protein (TIGR03435 family)
MKPRPNLTGKEMHESLALFNTLSTTDIDELSARALRYLESQSFAEERVTSLPSSHAARTSRWPAMALASAIVAIVCLMVLPRILRVSAGVLDDGTGSRQIHYGELVTAIGEGSALLSVADGSRIEMQSRAELSLERVDDGGIRVRLNKGGVIVDAANKPVYVETKHMVAAVTAAVSLVHAEKDGSRITALDGQVRVQQGTEEKTLGPGGNTATNPRMDALALASELAWSRHAAEHMAMAQQAAASALTQRSAERVGFEVTSIKPAVPPVAGNPPVGGGMGGLPPGDELYRPDNGCVPGSTQQRNPGRVVIKNATLFQLISYAYPVQGMRGGTQKNCVKASKVGLFSGAPAWVKADLWNLEATFPEGAFSSTPAFDNPKLQRMYQTMLAERFNLVIRQETREVPVYLLKVGKNGPKFNGVAENYRKLYPPEGRTLPDGRQTPSGNGFAIFGFRFFNGQNVSMAEWASDLFGIDNRPVLDRTGLTGQYDFHFDFSPLTSGPGMFSQIEEMVQRESVKAMGFELEESRALFQVWIIENVDRPSGN